MSLLNSLVGALTGGGQSGGLGGLAEMAAKNPQLMQVAASMLSGSNKHGGLQGLMSALQSNGLGEQAQSWVSEGENREISGAEMERALGGPQAMAKIALKANVPPAEASGLLAQLMPMLVNQMTPKGQMPSETPANGDALMQMLGGLMGKR